MFHPQESRTFSTANTRHNIKIKSLASLSLANVWLTNFKKIWRWEAREGSAVSIGYVSDDQMNWNVINGGDGFFEDEFFIWFSITAGLSFENAEKRSF